MKGYKAAHAAHDRIRTAGGVLLLLLAIAGGFVAGRVTGHGDGSAAPSSEACAYGIAYTADGVPTGFPRTRRGAGDAAAWYETLMSAAGQRSQTAMRALLTRLVDPAVQPGLVDALTPSTVREGDGGQ